MVLVESLNAGRVRLEAPPRYTFMQKFHEFALQLGGWDGNAELAKG